MDQKELQTRIERFYEERSEGVPTDFNRVFEKFIEGLNRGLIRAAECSLDEWNVNGWVKKGILVGFQYGSLKEYSIDDSFRFFDKNTYPLRETVLSDNVRIVPGGTSVRAGSFVSPGVVVMPPAYVNVGAYVDEGTMIDSHALVGSCAQIGKRVHISAGAQIGGVLEPVGAMPVIIEDDVLVGGNSGIYEGTVVKTGAVIGAGTILTGSIPVYDLVNESILRRSGASPLTIPANAVVVPGSRPLQRLDFAARNGLHLQCAIIVKYRDQKTSASSELERALR